MSEPQRQFEYETLMDVLGKMFDVNIVQASYEVRRLHGGTLGDVQLVTGMADTYDAETDASGRFPYSIVHKVQRRWERPGDPSSWRREYDLYSSDFGRIFSDSLRWPKPYHAEMKDDEIQLWLEYIDGVSGEELDIASLECAATEWGLLQGRLYKQPELLDTIDYLSEPDALKRSYNQWHAQTFSLDFLVSEQCRLPEFMKQMLRDGDIQLCDGKSLEYSCLRSSACAIPEHLEKLIYDIDDNRDEVFSTLSRLPVVLCHRDFWAENILMSHGHLRLIDWDCAGMGYMGEDIASLIYDDIKTDDLPEYFQRLIPAYVKGISEYIDVPPDFVKYIQTMILVVFGYRIVQSYMFTQSLEAKQDAVPRLQTIHDMAN